MEDNIKKGIKIPPLKKTQIIAFLLELCDGNKYNKYELNFCAHFIVKYSDIIAGHLFLITRILVKNFLVIAIKCFNKALEIGIPFKINKCLHSYLCA